MAGLNNRFEDWGLGIGVWGLNPHTSSLKPGKKGVFFTFLAILVVAVMLVAFTPRQTFRYEGEAEATKARVNYANTYVKDLDTYIEQALRISGSAALRALSEYINQSCIDDGSCEYLTEPNLHNYFKELVIHGTLKGGTVRICTPNLPNPPRCGENLTSGKAFNERITIIETLSSNWLHIDVDFDLGHVDVEMFQSNYSGPFHIGVNATLNYTVNAGVASWNKTNEVIQTRVSIEGIYDPLYYKKYPDGYSPQSWHLKVKEANYTNSKNETFYYHIRERRYNYNKDAPSFLQRFYNDFSPSQCCGIESPINPDVMTNFPDGTPQIAEVHVDWCVYSDRCSGKLWYISCITPYYGNFSLDMAHALNNIYNVTSTLYDDNIANPGCCHGQTQTQAPECLRTWPP